MNKSMMLNKKPRVKLATGRPTKKNEFVIKKITRMLKDGNSIKDACRVAGITDATFHNWNKTDKDINCVFESAKAEYFADLRKSVKKEAKASGILAHKVLTSEAQYENDPISKPIVINIGGEMLRVTKEA